MNSTATVVPILDESFVARSHTQLLSVREQNRVLGWSSIVSLCAFGLVLGCITHTPVMRGSSGVVLLSSLAIGAVFNIVSVKLWLEPCSRPCALYSWLDLFSLFGSPLYYVALTTLLLRTARTPFSSDAAWQYHTSALSWAALLATWMYQTQGGYALDAARAENEPCEHLFLRHWTTYQIGRALYGIGFCIFLRAWRYMGVALSDKRTFSERRKTVIRAFRIVLPIQALPHVSFPAIVYILRDWTNMRIVAFWVECLLDGLSVAIPSIAWLVVFCYGRNLFAWRLADSGAGQNEISEAVRERLMWLLAKGICQSAEGAASEKVHVDMYGDREVDVVVDGITYRVSSMSDGAFAEIRSKFGIGNDEEHGYVRSIETPAKEKFTEGKSGAFMYFTRNNRYIIKTATSEEYCVLRRILPSYIEHIQLNPDTLINPLLGAYELKFYNSPVRVIVVQSVFFGAPPEFSAQERYDLKGSWVGRASGLPKERKSLPWWKSKDGFDFTGVRKDLDVKGPFLIDKHRGQAIAEVLTCDSHFLAENKIMDYSLLVGVSKTTHAINAERQHSSQRFSVARASHVVGPDILCMGIIDVLQEFNCKKKMEYVLKRYLLRQGPGISCVPARDYGRRFRANIVRPLIGGDDPAEDSDDSCWGGACSLGSYYSESEKELSPLE